MENENNRYTVIISEKAAELLLIHVRFIANVSEDAAQKLIVDFNHSARSLETTPERNPWLSDPTLPINKYRKMVFSKRYLIIYQIKEVRVYIDFVLDCRQDFRWLL